MLGQPSKKTIAKYMYMVSLEGRMWSEGEIVSFRSLLNNKLQDQPDVKAELLERFNKSLEFVPFKLEKAQQIKGLAWLHKTQINKRGDLRNANTTFIGEVELSMIRTFESFEFIGLYDIAAPQQRALGCSQYVAQYRLNSVAGTYFEYGPDFNGGFKVFNICTSRATPRPMLKVV